MKARRFFLAGLSTAAGFGLLAVALVAVNVVAGFLPVRLDITEENLFTLSEGSKKIVQNLAAPATVKYYFSESLENTPVVITAHARRVRELLQEFQAVSGGKVALEISDPKPDTDEEEWATRYGLSGAQLPNGSRLMHGLVVLSEGREATVPFFDPRREKFLEYDIAEAFTRIAIEKQPTLGVLSSLPVLFPGFAPPQQRPPDWAVIQELRKSFKVQNLAPQELVEIPPEVTLLLVIHPKRLPAPAAYAVDQYVMRGGRLMVFTDPFSRHDVSSQQQMSPDFKSDLPELFKAWNIKFDSDRVVADQALATQVNTPNQGVLSFPVWISLAGKSFNRESVITGQLGEVILLDAGSFEAGKDFKGTFTPLLTSSEQAGTVDAVTVRMVAPADVGKSAKMDGKAKTLAALVTAKLPSAFPAGPPKAPPPPKEGEQAEPPKRTLPHLAAPEKEATILLVGDADFIGDRYSVQTVSFFGQKVLTPINDNLNFVLNAAEFLAGNQNLIHVRSRGKFSRPFTRVDGLRVAAQQQFQQQEKVLSASLESVRAKLRTLEGKKEGQKVLLSNEQLEAIKKFRLEEQRTSRALREVRKVLRSDIEMLGNSLLAINLVVVPLLVAMAGFFIIFRRAKRTGGGK